MQCTNKLRHVKHTQLASAGVEIKPKQENPGQRQAGACLTTGFPGGGALLYLLISMVYTLPLWPRSSHPHGTTEPRAGKRWPTARLRVIFPPLEL